MQSLLVLWLNQRFDLSPETTGAVFFGVGLLGAVSQLVSGPLAQRIGLVETMAYTHLPANMLLVLAAFAPTAGLAVAAILGRSLLSQMDVPARQALVMTIVPPAERMSAASITNVPRSLAAAATPLAAGALLAQSDAGWPLVIGGLAKAPTTWCCCSDTAASSVAEQRHRRPSGHDSGTRVEVTCRDLAGDETGEVRLTSRQCRRHPLPS